MGERKHDKNVISDRRKGIRDKNSGRSVEDEGQINAKIDHGEICREHGPYLTMKLVQIGTTV